MSIATAARPVLGDGATPQPETTTIEAASIRLGIGRSLAYQLAREGRFPVPVIRAGRRLLVPVRALDRALLADRDDAGDLAR